MRAGDRPIPQHLLRRPIARSNRRGAERGHAHLSQAGLIDFRGRCEQWRLRAANLARERTALRPWPVLTPLQRPQVLRTGSVYASVLRSSVGKYGIRRCRQRGSPFADRIALVRFQTSQIDIPMKSRQRTRRALRLSMLTGSSGRAARPERQTVRVADAYAVATLVLESDSWGPRFMWWDVGTSRSGFHPIARSCRFDCVKAEIEDYEIRRHAVSRAAMHRS
jgi:hypothetical protein